MRAHVCNHVKREGGDTHALFFLCHTLNTRLTHTNTFVYTQEVCAALNAVCRLTTEDTIPAVLPEVLSKLKHEVRLTKWVNWLCMGTCRMGCVRSPPTLTVTCISTTQQEAVRKKAVMALQRFHSLQPSSIAHLDGPIRRALCDKDPSVMAAALCLLLDLIKCVNACASSFCCHPSRPPPPIPHTDTPHNFTPPQTREDPRPYRDLVPSFVSILKQVPSDDARHMDLDVDAGRVGARFT